MNFIYSVIIGITLVITTQHTIVDSTENLKHILLWVEPKFKTNYLFNLLGSGTAIFEKKNCLYQNCYVTHDRNYFGGDLTQFDALVFNGRYLRSDDLPGQRTPDQDYVYMNTESAKYFPVCNDVFDNFFNITVTYRLDSDVPMNYFHVKTLNGKIVGPNIDMNWEEGLEVPDSYLESSNKTKAVAWFVSNCNAKSSRMEFARKLQEALHPYGFDLDIYGRCGTLTCQKDRKFDCEKQTGNSYYFYYSAENSFCEDYVTEKAIIPLRNEMVPIVYGGADYYRFLPPHSFIDSRAYTPNELAALIVKLINSPQEYMKYFGWKQHYQYGYANRGQQMCDLCEALNRTPKTKLVYEQFRRWWYPNYKSEC